MKYSIIPMSALFVTGLVLPLHADTLLNYETGNNYVSSDETFNSPSVDSGSGPYVSLRAFSSSTQLSPTSGYTGPVFYGGYEFTSSTVDGHITREQVRQYTDEDEIYLQSFKSGGWLDSTLTLHGIYIFQQADFDPGFETGQVSLDGVSMTWGGYGNTKGGEAFDFEGRLAVQVSGSYYLSQTVIDLANNNGSYSVSGSSLTNELWAIYDPSSDLNFDAGSASFGSLSLNSITAVGLYFEEDGWTGTDAANAAYGLGIRSFEATGTVVPEKSELSMLFGIAVLAIAGIWSRYRRNKTVA